MIETMLICFVYDVLAVIYHDLPLVLILSRGELQHMPTYKSIMYSSQHTNVFFFNIV